MRIILLFCLLSSVGCITAGDLHRLQTADDSFRLEVRAKLVDLEAGTITSDQFDSSFEKLNDKRNSDIKTVVDDAAKRTEELIALIGDVKTGAVDLTTLLGGGAGVGILSHLYTMFVRSRSRREEFGSIRRELAPPGEA